MARRKSFTKAQRSDLSGCGLTAVQIEALENRALHVVASAATPFSYGPFREALQEVEEMARMLARRIELLRTAPDPGAHEAYWRLMEADSSRKAKDSLANPMAGYPTNPDPDELAVELKRLAELASDELKRVKGKQSRHRIAATYPVRWIEETLLEVWVEENQREGEPLPSYGLEVSYAPNSPFRRIVGICYQAAGHPTEWPERAIKAHIAEKAQRYGWLDEMTASNATKAETKPRTVGRKKGGAAVR